MLSSICGVFIEGCVWVDGEQASVGGPCVQIAEARERGKILQPKTKIPIKLGSLISSSMTVSRNGCQSVAHLKEVLFSVRVHRFWLSHC